MKIGRFVESGKETYGLVKDGHVATREEITYETGVPLPYSIKDFLFDGWFEEIKKKSPTLSYNENLSKYTILAPIPNPPKIICLAFNYIDHAEEQKIEPSEGPVIVMKPRTALTGTNSEIRSPTFVKKLDYEVELALVIGQNCKNVDESKAMEVIFGYMIFDDVPNPQNLKIMTKINGELRQNSSTSKMFLKIPSIVSKLSKVMTLEKGDIISTGTPKGVILNNSNLEFLKDGDHIEMEIEKLGKLENTIKFVDE